MTWEQFMSIGDALTQFTTLHDLTAQEQLNFSTISLLAMDLISAATIHGDGDFAWFTQELNNAHMP